MPSKIINKSPIVAQLEKNLACFVCIWVASSLFTCVIRKTDHYQQRLSIDGDRRVGFRVFRYFWNAESVTGVTNSEKKPLRIRKVEVLSPLPPGWPGLEGKNTSQTHQRHPDKLLTRPSIWLHCNRIKALPHQLQRMLAQIPIFRIFVKLSMRYVSKLLEKCTKLGSLVVLIFSAINVL